MASARYHLGLGLLWLGVKMANEAIRLAKIEREKVLTQSFIDAGAKILTDPGVVMVLGTAAIEYLQGHDEWVLRADPVAGVHKWEKRRLPGGSWFGSIAGSVAEGGLVANASQGLLTGGGNTGGGNTGGGTGGLLGILAGLFKK